MRPASTQHSRAWRRPCSGWAENARAAHLTTRQRIAFGHLVEPHEAKFLDAFLLPKDPLRQLMQVRAKVHRQGTNDAHWLPSHRQRGRFDCDDGFHHACWVSVTHSDCAKHHPINRSKEAVDILNRSLDWAPYRLPCRPCSTASNLTSQFHSVRAIPARLQPHFRHSRASLCPSESCDEQFPIAWPLQAHRGAGWSWVQEE